MLASSEGRVVSAPGDVLSASGRDARVCGAVQHVLCQRYQSTNAKASKDRAHPIIHGRAWECRTVVATGVCR